jgi:UDP-glucose 4-epimerase
MKLKSRRVLVAGGAGFVGSNLVKRLCEEGAVVTVLDDLFTGNLAFVGHHAKFVSGSVTDYDLVETLVKDSDVIFNLAARNIIVSTEKPREDFEVNVGGMLNILMAAKKYRVDRVVYASSASVYGNFRYVPINEDDGLVVLNPYAASKLSAEHYCMAFWESYGVPTMILRYSNVYGYNQSAFNPYCGVVAKFFDSVINGLPLQIHGDGEQTRDFTFVDDAVEATILAARSPKAVGEVFNVGTGKETSVNQLANMIVNMSEKDVDIVHVDRRDIDNLRRRVLNVEKSRRVLRWIPMTSLGDGLYNTYKWLLSVQTDGGYGRRDG